MEESVLNLNSEAERLVLLITALLLNINFKFFIAENCNYSPSHSSYIYNNNTVIFSSHDENKSPTINLFKRFGHYDIVYPKIFVEQHKMNLYFFRYNEATYDKLKIEMGYLVKEENVRCLDCHEENSTMIKFPDLNGTVCKECLLIYVKDIMEQRVKYFLSEQYFNLECKD
ncbi:MAG: hypothetical protein GY853_00605 [PVC group bacterium]|nr:hypothetical protein [PVC group bacterium]